MAVLRQEVQGQIAQADTRRAVQGGITGGNTSAGGKTYGGDGGWSGALAMKFNSLLGDVGTKLVDQQITDAYAQGASQAALGKSEAELANDTLTRDWEVAGFRDTVGQLAAAKLKADVAAKMPEMAQRSPAEFKAWYDEQQAQVLPVLNAMSAKQRQNMLPQVALDAAAAAASHAGSHKAFIVEKRKTGLADDFMVSLKGMDFARNNVQTQEAYAAATDASMGTVWRMMADDSLPHKDKQDMIVQFAQAALNRRHLDIYDRMSNVEMPTSLVDPTKRTALSLLDMDQREKLGKAYYTAQESVAAIANTDFTDRIEIYRNQMQHGEVPMSYEQWTQMLDAGQRLGVIKDGQRSGLISDYLNAQYKASTAGFASAAYFSGNVNWMKANNMTEEQALAYAQKDMSVALQSGAIKPDDLIAKYASAADRGMTSAYKEIGSMVGPAVTALNDPNGKPNANSLATLAATGRLLDSFKDQPGGDFRASQVLSGMSDDQRLRFQRARELLRAGYSGEQTVAKLQDLERADANLSPELRRAVMLENAKDDKKLIDKIGSQGFFTNLWQRAASLVSTDAEKRRALEAPGATGLAKTQFQEQARIAVGEELTALSLVGGHSSEQRAEGAMANVLNRTAPINGTALILPRGTNVKSFFNLPEGTNTATVTQAITDLTKPQADKGQVTYIVQGNRVLVQQYDKDGVPFGANGYLEPKAVQERVQALQKDRHSMLEGLFGNGHTIKTATGTVQFNGINSAGVNEQAMFDLRKNLASNEGVRDKPYKDAKGNETIGVGIYSKEYWPTVFTPDGSIPQSEISRTFRAASNDAATAAVRVQKAQGRFGDQWFKLYGELAYQSGKNFDKLPGYSAFFKAGTAEEAQAAFKETPAYKSSGEARQKHYNTLIAQAFGQSKILKK